MYQDIKANIELLESDSLLSRIACFFGHGVLTKWERRTKAMMLRERIMVTG